MKIEIIIVLYNTLIENSKTLNSIRTISEFYNFPNFSFIIYDNSPKFQDIPNTFTLPTKYLHDCNNGGLSAAYNYALENCNKNNIKWLLLLDQDTDLTKEFFIELEDSILKTESIESIVCIVPKITSNNKLISPVIPRIGGIVKPINLKTHGVCNNEISAINSGTLIKVDFVNSLGGFNNNFKLDMLDYWLFFMINKNNKCTFVLNSILTHNLSVSDYSTIDEKRYLSIISAESLFYRDYSSKINYLTFKVRLIFRFFKQLIKVENLKICLITLKFLFH